MLGAKPAGLLAAAAKVLTANAIGPAPARFGRPSSPSSGSTRKCRDIILFGLARRGATWLQ
jgi:hypothetical protein